VSVDRCLASSSGNFFDRWFSAPRAALRLPLDCIMSLPIGAHNPGSFASMSSSNPTRRREPLLGAAASGSPLLYFLVIDAIRSTAGSRYQEPPSLGVCCSACSRRYGPIGFEQGPTRLDLWLGSAAQHHVPPARLSVSAPQTIGSAPFDFGSWFLLAWTRLLFGCE
jgi:hypothetical protein